MWRIYYGDGSTYDGDPYFAPALDVQVIVENDPRILVHGWHHYWYEKDQWYGGDLFGLWDYLTRPGPKKVIFGRTIETEDFRQLLESADNDPDFPRPE